MRVVRMVSSNVSASSMDRVTRDKFTSISTSDIVSDSISIKLVLFLSIKATKAALRSYTLSILRDAREGLE